jgi:hypothetical protein
MFPVGSALISKTQSSMTVFSVRFMPRPKKPMKVTVFSVGYTLRSKTQLTMKKDMRLYKALKLWRIIHHNRDRWQHWDDKA